MDLNELKLGFLSYLQELQRNTASEEESGNEEIELNDFSEVSIFTYSQQFKDYIQDEYNVSDDILSMSINDIMNMEIVNGKLVDTKKTDNTSNAPEAETAEDTANAADLTENNNENGATGATDEFNFVDLLNLFLEDENFIKEYDEDGNGEISDEEFLALQENLKYFDGNGENLSLDDIISKAVDPKEDEWSEADIQSEGLGDGAPIQPSNNASGGGGVNNSGGGSYNSGSDSDNTVQEKTLDNMTKDELNSELSKANSDLSEKQGKLKDLFAGKELEDLKDAQDEAYDAYHEELEAVDEEMAKEVDDIKNNIDTKQEEIDKKEQEIAEQEVTVSDCENEYNNAVATTKALESSLDALKSVDTSSMEASQKSDLDSKIAACEAKLDSAREHEEQAKQNWDDAKEKLETLKEEKEELISGEGGLDELNDLMEEKEEEILKAYPDIAESLKNYQDSRKDYDDARQERDTEITSLKTEIQKSQDYVNKVKTAISNYNDKETVSEFMLDGLTDQTKNAIELAFQELYAGVREDRGDNRGTMEKYGGGAGVPWCAAFVSWLYRKGQGNTNGPLDYSASVSGLRDQAKAEGYYSDKNSYMPVPGDVMIQKSDGASHTGLVVAVEGNTIYTIEGNSNDAVRARKYTVGQGRYSKISGWIRMNEWTGGASNIPTDTYLEKIKRAAEGDNKSNGKTT